MSSAVFSCTVQCPAHLCGRASRLEVNQVLDSQTIRRVVIYLDINEADMTILNVCDYLIVCV